MKRQSIARALTALILIPVAGLLLWASDQITLRGEHTIFTVGCEGGEWTGEQCTGTLVPGERYAYRASRSRNEVLHWVRGSDAPSGVYRDCKVKDRDDWTCNVTTAQVASVTCEIVRGRPERNCNGLTPPFHYVPKWKWWAMRIGLTVFTDAQG